MTETGSIAERQEFLRGGAKPPFRLRDRATIILMTGAGWEGELRLHEDSANVIASLRSGRQALSTQPASAVVRHVRALRQEALPMLVCC